MSGRDHVLRISSIHVQIYCAVIETSFGQLFEFALKRIEQIFLTMRFIEKIID